MKKIAGIALVCLFSLVASGAFAVETYKLSQNKAEEAVGIISSQKEVGNYCRPCGHAGMEVSDVFNSTMQEYEGQWVVLINGEFVDVSDIYINKKGAWQNLASILGFKITGNPQYYN